MPRTPWSSSPHNVGQDNFLNFAMSLVKGRSLRIRSEIPGSRGRFWGGVGKG